MPKLNDATSVAAQTTPQPVRLADYTPPEFLVDTVDLSFELDEAATRVRSRLALRRNPAARDRSAPLRLNGEALTLLRVCLNGETLSANQYRLDHDALCIPDMPDERHAGDRHAHRAEGQHRAERAVHLQRQLLHPVRGGRLPPHHLVPGPPGRDGALHRDDHRRQGAVPGDAVQRQSGRGARTRAAAGTASPGPIRTRSPATCSRWWPATWCR